MENKVVVPTKNRIADQAKKKAKKGILRVVFSRTALIAALILLQLAMFDGLLTFLKEYAVYVYGLTTAVQAGTIVFIMNERTSPEFSRTWMLLVMVMPVFGCFFYLYAKLELGTRFIGKRLESLKIETDPYLKQERGVLESLRASKPANANLAHYLNQQIHFPTFIFAVEKKSFPHCWNSWRGQRSLSFWNTLLCHRDICGILFWRF